MATVYSLSHTTICMCRDTDTALQFTRCFKHLIKLRVHKLWPRGQIQPFGYFVNSYIRTQPCSFIYIYLWLLSRYSSKTEWLQQKLCIVHTAKNIYYPALNRKCLPIPRGVSNCDDIRNAVKPLNLFSTEEMQISLIFSLFCQLAFSISFFVLFNILGQFPKEQKLITEKGSSQLRDGLCSQRSPGRLFLMHLFHRNISSNT